MPLFPRICCRSRKDPSAERAMDARSAAVLYAAAEERPRVTREAERRSPLCRLSGHEY